MGFKNRCALKHVRPPIPPEVARCTTGYKSHHFYGVLFSYRRFGRGCDLQNVSHGTNGLEERFSQIDSHLLLRKFSKMKLQNRKIPADARKLIKEDQMLEKIEKMFLAVAS